MDAGVVLHRLRRFADAHGFGGITFHALRHGAASLLLVAGVADNVALEAMGHADTNMLLHYQEVADGLKRDPAARLDALLGVSSKKKAPSREG